jgi:hypothetical protein
VKRIEDRDLQPGPVDTRDRELYWEWAHEKGWQGASELSAQLQVHMADFAQGRAAAAAPTPLGTPSRYIIWPEKQK